MTEYLPGYGSPPALAIWLRAVAAILERAAYWLDPRPASGTDAASDAAGRTAAASDAADRAAAAPIAAPRTAAHTSSPWARRSGASRVEAAVLLAMLAFFAGGTVALLTLP